MKFWRKPFPHGAACDDPCTKHRLCHTPKRDLLGFKNTAQLGEPVCVQLLPLAKVFLSPLPSVHTSLGIWEAFKATEYAQGATRLCVSWREPSSQLPHWDVTVSAWVRMSDISSCCSIMKRPPAQADPTNSCPDKAAQGAKSSVLNCLCWMAASESCPQQTL